MKFKKILFWVAFSSIFTEKTLFATTVQGRENPAQRLSTESAEFMSDSSKDYPEQTLGGQYKNQFPMKAMSLLGVLYKKMNQDEFKKIYEESKTKINLKDYKEREGKEKAEDLYSSEFIMDENTSLSDSLKLLSLDGGGAKGFITSALLAILEEYINLMNPQQNWHYLSDFFDAFAGCSTGSIIAAGLCYKGEEGQKYRAHEIAQIFYRHLPDVFSSISSMAGGGTIKSKYDHAKFLTLLDMYFPNATATRFEKKCYIASTRISSDNRILPHIFGKDIINKNQVNLGDLYIYQMLSASVAAPTYFPKFEVKYDHLEYKFVDGGLIANNPSEMAIDQLLCNDSSKKIAVFNMGTGIENESSTQKESFIDPLNGLSYLVSSLDAQAHTVRNNIRRIVHRKGDVCYYSCLNPLLKSGMTVDSTDSNFIENALDTAFLDVFKPTFLKMICMLNVDLNFEKLMEAIKNVNKKMHSIGLYELNFLLDQNNKSPRREFLLDYIARRIIEDDIHWLKKENVRVMDMEKGILNPVKKEDLNEIYEILIKRGDETSKKIETVRCVKNYLKRHHLKINQEKYDQIIEDANQIKLLNNKELENIVDGFLTRDSYLKEAFKNAGNLAILGKDVSTSVAYEVSHFIRSLWGDNDLQQGTDETYIDDTPQSLEVTSHEEASDFIIVEEKMVEKNIEIFKFIVCYLSFLKDSKIVTQDDQTLSFATVVFIENIFKDVQLSKEFGTFVNVIKKIKDQYATVINIAGYTIQTGSRLDTLVTVLDEKNNELAAVNITE